MCVLVRRFELGGDTLHKHKVLSFGDRFCLTDDDGVAHLRGIASVVDEILLRLAEVLLVLRVHHVAHDRHGRRIFHRRFNDGAAKGLSLCFCFHTDWLSYAVFFACTSSRARSSVRMRAISLRKARPSRTFLVRLPAPPKRNCRSASRFSAIAFLSSSAVCSLMSVIR